MSIVSRVNTVSDTREKSAKSWKKNPTFFHSVAVAFVGLFSFIRQERNARIYIGIAAVFLCIDIAVGIPTYGYIVWLVTFMGAEAAEILNTASENICDIVDENDNPRIKYIKDIAAANVLMWGFAFFGSQAVLICGTLFGWL